MIHSPPLTSNSRNSTGNNTKVNCLLQTSSTDFSLEFLEIVAQDVEKLLSSRRFRRTVDFQLEHLSQGVGVSGSTLPAHAIELSNRTFGTTLQWNRSLNEALLLPIAPQNGKLIPWRTKYLSLLILYVPGHDLTEWHTILKDTIGHVKYPMKCGKHVLLITYTLKSRHHKKRSLTVFTEMKRQEWLPSRTCRIVYTFKKGCCTRKNSKGRQ